MLSELDIPVKKQAPDAAPHNFPTQLPHTNFAHTAAPDNCPHTNCPHTQLCYTETLFKESQTLSPSQSNLIISTNTQLLWSTGTGCYTEKLFLFIYLFIFFLSPCTVTRWGKALLCQGLLCSRISPVPQAVTSKDLKLERSVAIIR